MTLTIDDLVRRLDALDEKLGAHVEQLRDGVDEVDDSSWWAVLDECSRELERLTRDARSDLL